MIGLERSKNAQMGSYSRKNVQMCIIAQMGSYNKKSVQRPGLSNKHGSRCVLCTLCTYIESPQLLEQRKQGGQWVLAELPLKAAEANEYVQHRATGSAVRTDSTSHL